MLPILSFFVVPFVFTAAEHESTQQHGYPAAVSNLSAVARTTAEESLPGNVLANNPSLIRTPTDVSDSLRTRLTVRPKEMATGTETRVAGLTPLEGFAGYFVYVPEQCVGKTRAPLVVLLHGGGRSGAQEIKKFKGLADQYGMIVLAANALEPGRWDVIGGFITNKTTYTRSSLSIQVSAFPERDVRHLDSAIIKVLHTHAIDPDRLALLGF